MVGYSNSQTPLRSQDGEGQPGGSAADNENIGRRRAKRRAAWRCGLRV